MIEGEYFDAVAFQIRLDNIFGFKRISPNSSEKEPDERDC